MPARERRGRGAVSSAVAHDLLAAIERRMEVSRRAEALLGERASFLLIRHGKVMAGPNVGKYMSGLSSEELLDLVERVGRGETVPVHLMHRHRKGCYEASSLRMSKEGLVMVFQDREVLA